MNAEILKGDPPGGIIVLRFPSEDVIRAFVNDPEQQPLKKIRLQTTANASAVVVPEFSMPGTYTEQNSHSCLCRHAGSTLPHRFQSESAQRATMSDRPAKTAKPATRGMIVPL